MSANAEKSSPLNLPPAPNAPSTKKSKGKKKRKQSVAQREQEYIIRKYVKPDKINWPRDAAVLSGLRKNFPEYAFWYSLPAYFQMNTLQGFLRPKAQAFLKLEYAKFNLQLPEPEPIILLSEPLVQPIPSTAKPRNLLEFCR